MRIKTKVQAGSIKPNHNQTVNVKTGLKAGRNIIGPQEKR